MWSDNDTLRQLFGNDGQIHTVQAPTKPSAGRKNILNDVTFREAYVCLTCTAETCEGERKCFLKRRKKLLEEKQNGK